MLAGVVGGACSRDLPVGILFAFGLALVYRLAVNTIELEIEQTKGAALSEAKRMVDMVHRELVVHRQRGPKVPS
jgi:hypothetical protein